MAETLAIVYAIGAIAVAIDTHIGAPNDRVEPVVFGLLWPLIALLMAVAWIIGKTIEKE